MKILEAKSLVFENIKTVKFARFCDQRGYFAETFRASDLLKALDITKEKMGDFVQGNESFSKKTTIRGMHFQWNPYMGKMVRTVQGRMIDLVLDIRKGAPTYGKIIAYEMASGSGDNFNEWIWVPPGFAHGNCFLEDTRIEYLCTGEYSQNCEACLSVLSDDIDWSMCEPGIRKVIRNVIDHDPIITDKDKSGLSLSQWSNDARSGHFIYGKI
jgi:dTDP-4-dehydrorhamnose 3,5-epimerase